METTYDVLAPFHSIPERDAALSRLRREDPIHWDAANEWWLLTRHADIREVSRQAELFSSEPKGPWHPFEAHFSMQAMDGEPHRRHRGIVSRAFTPRMVTQLAERAGQYADEAIDALAGRREGDFVADLAVPVPMRVIADMLGVADGDIADFRQWSDAAVTAGSGQAGPDEMAEASRLLGDFHGYVRAAVARRRVDPGEDMLSRIIEADQGGLLDAQVGFEHLEEDEVTDFAVFLLIAGNETTRNGISQGMLALFEHPEQHARLRADPALWETAPSEILRWTSPVRAMRRVAMRDTKLGGQRIREGESVVMVYASGNRDEAVFEDPHAFQVDRTPNEHLAFGLGAHYCLGANLARMEIRAVMSKILQRLPEIRLRDGARPVQTNSALIDGLEELPVQW